ncbi:MAG TPA: ATP-binding protein, partial [Candidatus Brocadiales bacterium]|nr:ATP-binding protein [Candidatus Brocadiales bacterium]
IGIRDDIKARIFDPFFTTKPDGTGLGLSIAHKIIELHYGWITVQSELQNGTIFLVNLPGRGERRSPTQTNGVRPYTGGQTPFAPTVFTGI